MRYSSLIILIFFVALSALPACASNEIEEQRADETEADASSEDAAAAEDTRSEDTQDGVEEVEAPPFCTPSDDSCADESTTRVCAADGSEFVEEVCGEDEECVDAACVTRPVCSEGEKKCYDASNLMTCRPGGAAWRTETCSGGTTCVDGACVSGAPNGQTCAEDDDCANGVCRCGAGDSCEPVAGQAVTPYCTGSCTPGSCGSGEVCLSAADFAPGGQDHCVKACDQTCALDGMTCASIPTRDSGALTFESACVPEGVIDIGMPCDASNADACAGGTCIDDYFEVGFCTSECTGDCPGNTACVKVTSSSDVFHCVPICGDGTPGASTNCPLQGGEDLWSITCKPKSDFEGSAVQVCAKSS